MYRVGINKGLPAHYYVLDVQGKRSNGCRSAGSLAEQKRLQEVKLKFGSSAVKTTVTW